MMDDSSQTMPMLVANLSSGYSIDYGVLMLGVLICSLPTGILFLVLQKSFANGIVGGCQRIRRHARYRGFSGFQ